MLRDDTIKRPFEEWYAKGEELYGNDPLKWRFECPACKNVTTPEDFRQFKDQGADPNSAVQNCIGRFTGGRKGPNKCDWAAYGLFRGPHCVIKEGKEVWVFPFADEV